MNSERQPPTLDDIAAALQQARAHHQHMVRILSAQVRIGRLAFPTDGEFATAGLALAEHQRILEVLSKALEVIHGR